VSVVFTWLSMEFLVQNAIFMLECVKRLAMYVVSFPVQVNMAHFRFGVDGSVMCLCLCVRLFCGLIRNELLFSML
jgi:hypothetical protein